MKNILLGAVLTLAVLAALTIGIAFSGRISMAADEPHEPWVLPLLEAIRETSIAHQSDGIAVPANFNDPESVRRGAGNYEAMCADCHLRPGEADSEISIGLYPRPKNLARKNDDASLAAAPSRQFWIIKHGIKATGMPAWSKGGMTDGDIWNLVAFLRQFPRLAPERYRTLVASSEGHSHSGTADEPREPHPGHTHAHRQAFRSAR